MERVKTGILGFDELIEGGFPRGATVLVYGPCGSGKTTFGIQFLYKGATEFEEPGVYITLESEAEEVRRYYAEMGWELEKLEDENKIRIIKVEPSTVRAFVERQGTSILEIIQEVNAKRLVFDSLTFYAMYFSDDFERRKSVLDLCNLIKKLGCTAIIIAEAFDKHPVFSGMAEFIVDGVIRLDLIKMGPEYKFSLNIIKMRGTKHSRKVHIFEINRGGIRITGALS